ncbi:hypothetical protein DLM85_16740 [Hymenobacter edaphi]|uniref:Uncharacterized protein n=1 Tax=Hymenobacter edaphi TaxID=2211146 RepID=A0A328BH23_9BACT|nr:hypothetical protein DLM85_16740 [Hymenobacter edaphi]
MHEQIALCQPNIIIGWNTLSYFEKDSDFLKKIGLPSGPRQSLGSVDYWFAGSKLFIDTYHPASFKIKQQQYVGDILQVVKINQNALNLDLPTGNL